MTHDKWQCPKCGAREFEVDEFRASGGALASFLDMQNKKFTTVSCTRCQYTEIYRTERSQIENVLDFLAS